MTRSFLLISMVVLLSGRSEGQLQQIWKSDVLGTGRNQEVVACRFDNETVTVLIRSSNSDSRGVAFSLRQFGQDGNVLSEKVIQSWGLTTGGPMDLAFSLSPSRADPNTVKTETLVLGQLIPDENGVIQQYSAAGDLQWTEPLPGGRFAFCLDIQPTQTGYVLAGAADSAASLVSIDFRGRTLWRTAGKKRHWVKRAAVLSNGNIVSLTNPTDSSTGEPSSLKLTSAAGEGLAEHAIEEPLARRQIKSLFGTVDTSWLAAKMNGDTIVFAQALGRVVPGEPGEPRDLTAELFSADLDRIGEIDFTASLSDWTYFFDVSKMDDDRLFLSGVADEKFAFAVATLEGDIVDEIRIPAPKNSLKARVWTDGRARVGVFLEHMEFPKSGGTVMAGTFYLLQSMKK